MKSQHTREKASPVDFDSDGLHPIRVRSGTRGAKHKRSVIKKRINSSKGSSRRESSHSVSRSRSRKKAKVHRPNRQSHSRRPEPKPRDTREYREQKATRRKREIRERLEILKIVKKVFDSNKIPSQVRNRGKEKNELVNFMKKNLRKDKGAKPTLIITGQPGVGKTLLLKDMMQNFNGKLMCTLSCMCHTALRKSKATPDSILREPKLQEAFAQYFEQSCICNPVYCESGKLVGPGGSRRAVRRAKLKDLHSYFSKNIFLKKRPKDDTKQSKQQKDSQRSTTQRSKKGAKEEEKDLLNVKCKVKANRHLVKVLKGHLFGLPEQVDECQDREFKFIFFNSTLFSDSITFLKGILRSIIELFEPQQQRFLRKKLGVSENIGNISLILTHIKRLLHYLDSKYFFVIVIDELDSLVKKDKKNFQFVSEFLNAETDNAVKIGVSNTYGLSNEVFDYKVQKDVARLIFAPYSEQQLKGIIQQRLDQELARMGHAELQVVDDYCLTFLFRRYMKNSWGDIRLLLKVFQEIIEKKITFLEMRLKQQDEVVDCEADEPEKENLDIEVDFEQMERQDEKRFQKDLIISIKDSMETINNFFCDKSLSLVKTLSLPTKILLFTICELGRSSEDSIQIKELTFFFKNNLKNYRNDVFDKMEHYLSVLESYNIISKQTHPKKNKNIKLSYPTGDLMELLRNDEALLCVLPLD